MRTRTEVVADLASQIFQAESDRRVWERRWTWRSASGTRGRRRDTGRRVRAAFADIYDRFAGQVVYVPLALNPSSDVSPGNVPTTLQFRTRLDADAGAALLEFYLPHAGRVRLTVVDVTGRQIAVVAEEPFPPGWHQVTWSLRDGAGRRVPSGVYFAKLEAGAEAPSRKILVVR